MIRHPELPTTHQWHFRYLRDVINIKERVKERVIKDLNRFMELDIYL